jgi:hypothetical protein
MIFTTNKALSTWGRVLHDEDLAQAIIDRVLECGRLLTLDGPSMRTKHLALDEPAAVGASIQGSATVPEFPGFQCHSFRSLHGQCSAGGPSADDLLLGAPAQGGATQGHGASSAVAPGAGEQ